MSEYIPSDQPIFAIEGRMGQTGQTFKETRAGALATLVGKEGIATVYVDAQNPNTYEDHGFITRVGVANGEHIEYHGLDEPLVPDAWRLRDVTWQDGDPAAYTSDRGYNTKAARTALATNAGMIWAMEDMGLQDVSIPTVLVRNGKPLESLPETSAGVLVKPSGKRTDVGEGRGRRAVLVADWEALPTAKDIFGGEAIVQPRMATLPVALFEHQFGLRLGEYPPASLHAIRVGGLLTKGALDPSYVEFRATRVTPDNDDIGKVRATEARVFSPDHLFTRLPELARLHTRVHTTLVNKFGRLNNLAVDYVCTSEGIKVASILSRAFLPDVKQSQPRRAGLARRTLTDEAELIKELAFRP